MNKTFTSGVMGSGKSKTLIEMYKDETGSKAAFSARIEEPTGCQGYIKSRNGLKIDSTYLNKNDSSDSIYNFLKSFVLLNDTKILFIDEIQFLGKDTIIEIDKLTDQLNLSVNYFGLLTTFSHDFFSSSKYLLEIIKRENYWFIDKLCESTGCINYASVNARTNKKKDLSSKNLFLADKRAYTSLCEDCYYYQINEITK